MDEHHTFWKMSGAILRQFLLGVSWSFRHKWLREISSKIYHVYKVMVVLYTSNKVLDLRLPGNHSNNFKVDAKQILVVYFYQVPGNR